MQILGVIVLLTGLVLILVARNLSRYLPPNYQETEDDGFLELMQSMAKLVGGAGAVLLVIGGVCVLVGVTKIL